MHRIATWAAEQWAAVTTELCPPQLKFANKRECARRQGESCSTTQSNNIGCTYCCADWAPPKKVLRAAPLRALFARRTNAKYRMLRANLNNFFFLQKQEMTVRTWHQNSAEIGKRIGGWNHERRALCALHGWKHTSVSVPSSRSQKLGRLDSLVDSLIKI